MKKFSKISQHSWTGIKYEKFPAQRKRFCAVAWWMSEDIEQEPCHGDPPSYTNDATGSCKTRKLLLLKTAMYQALDGSLRCQAPGHIGLKFFKFQCYYLYVTDIGTEICRNPVIPKRPYHSKNKNHMKAFLIQTLCLSETLPRSNN